jgi:hypothetical protein
MKEQIRNKCKRFFAKPMNLWRAMPGCAHVLSTQEGRSIGLLLVGTFIKPAGKMPAR